MGVRIVVPKNIKEGYYKKFRWFTFGWMAHTLQCDQIWIFLVEVKIQKKKFRFGYRTRGDASKDMLTYYDGGWHWPWQLKRTVSGRG